MAMKSRMGLDSTLRARELRGPSLLLLMLLSPLGLGASCDDAVVGEECAVGSKDERCVDGEAGSTNGNATGGGNSASGGNSAGGNGNSNSNGSGGDGAGDPDVCGGLLGEDCDAGEYCHYPLDAMCGAADGTGVCEQKPQACDDIYDPVCGCDDKTYANACEAAAKGVSIVAEGECDPPASGKCGSRGLPECPSGQFCQFDAASNCGAVDTGGTCVDIPEACILIYAPVCGCDGMTYGNACEANSYGVSVAKEGACPEDLPARSCGGLGGGSCAPDEFCDYPPSAMCGAADGTGTCAKKPQGCTKEYDPVCGCDDQTYGNPCMAASAGVSVLHSGECKSGGGAADCGGLLGLSCAKNEYCNYAPGDLCGTADATGKCAVKPENCIEIYQPVCGCDGKTYGNDCQAAMNGVSVAAEGECS